MSMCAFGRFALDGVLGDMRDMTLAGFEDSALRAGITAVHPLRGVRAGSSLLRFHDRLLAVQDDAWSIAWIALPDLTLTMQVLSGDGGPLPKKRKPDFEAALVSADGVIRLLGSGSRVNRCAVARLAPDGSALHLSELPDLYESIRQVLGLDGRPNIEAAILVGERLRLFHRGAGDSPSACIELSEAVLDGARPEVHSWHWIELGNLDGVPLHITDAAVFGSQRVAFLAAAERTDDAIADGPVAGTAVGFMEGAALRWSRLLEADGRPTLRKCEGIAIDDDPCHAWVITDPDDAERDAELLRVVIDGNG
jgi:hypothetical protein